MYIARTKYRGLRLFTKKPEKCMSTMGWDDGTGMYLEVDDNDFPYDLSWEDEPIKVSIMTD